MNEWQKDQTRDEIINALTKALDKAANDGNFAMNRPDGLEVIMANQCMGILSAMTELREHLIDTGELASE